MTAPPDSLQTVQLSANADYLAPDGSEIRLLPTMNGGGLCHCTLPGGCTSAPVVHHKVEEIWFVISGSGELWRKRGMEESTVPLAAGTSLTIPPQTAFQFRNAGHEPLCILICTMPPWPGPEEAMPADGPWKIQAQQANV
jgi:mannose-6-phosphate isomerase-like protein (cupin superfamily)